MKKKAKQTAIDKAFLGSDKHTLDDLNLQPWNPMRIIKAQGIGMRYPNLGKRDWDQYRETRVYRHAISDVMIFVYLSTLTGKDEVKLATEDEAEAFGIKRGLHQADSREFWEAYTKFIEVQNEIQTAATKPKTTPVNGTDDDDDEGNE
jgi:hypothetical protein